MIALCIFVGLVILIAVALMVLRLGGFKQAHEYFFRNKKGKTAWVGIAAFILVSIIGSIIALWTNKADAAEGLQVQYFNYAYLYLGAEYPFNEGASPQCQEEGPDNKWTSSGGFVVNGARFIHNRIVVDLNGKYQHHSCAINEDRFLYDSLGAELRLYFFRRK